MTGRRISELEVAEEKSGTDVYAEDIRSEYDDPSGA